MVDGPLEPPTNYRSLCYSQCWKWDRRGNLLPRIRFLLLQKFYLRSEESDGGTEKDVEVPRTTFEPLPTKGRSQLGSFPGPPLNGLPCLVVLVNNRVSGVFVKLKVPVQNRTEG